MKKVNGFLRKCKSLTNQLGRSSSSSSSSSYSCLRSKSNQDSPDLSDDADAAVVFVGSSKRRYTISFKHLNHPLMNALIEKPKKNGSEDDEKISVKCEVVLFDHLLWMLDNADPREVEADGALEELAQLYAC